MNQNQPKELFQVAGDAPDPTGTGARGVIASYDLSRTAIGHPIVLWKANDGNELLLTFDVFAPPNAPKYILIGCPMCAMRGKPNTLRIMEGGAKAFQYELGITPPLFPGWRDADVAGALAGDPSIDIRGGGRLSVEPFSCTWEEEPDLRRAFGMQRCTWRVRIDNNIARSA